MTDEVVTKEYADSVFRRLTMTADNRMCMDCSSKNPTWASIPHGIFICVDCAGRHRAMGVHISFVRSIKLDTWTRKQLAMMQVGGNKSARAFFKAQGLETATDQRYNTSSARVYRQQIAENALQRLNSATPDVSEGHGTVKQGPEALSHEWWSDSNSGNQKRIPTPVTVVVPPVSSSSPITSPTSMVSPRSDKSETSEASAVKPETSGQLPPRAVPSTHTGTSPSPTPGSIPNANRSNNNTPIPKSESTASLKGDVTPLPPSRSEGSTPSGRCIGSRRAAGGAKKIGITARRIEGDNGGDDPVTPTAVNGDGDAKPEN